MDIPEGVIDRLPKYARALGQLEAEGRDVVGDPALSATALTGLPAKPVAALERGRRAGAADIGIVATPAETAQEVIDSLVRCGVRAILNYAPAFPSVPNGVHVRHIDPVLALQAMTYHLKADSGPG